MVALACASLGWMAHAAAQPPVPAGPAVPVRAEVMVVLAGAAEGAVDPALAAIPALRQPPFDAYRSMSMLSRREVSLAPGQPVEVALPNGRQLRIELERTTPDGRHVVRVSITRAGQRDYLPLLQVIARPGEPFFVAGQSHLGGTLVIGVRTLARTG